LLSLLPKLGDMKEKIGVGGDGHSSADRTTGRTSHGCQRHANKETQNEFNQILLDRAVVSNLNALEDLIADAQKRQSRSISIPATGSSSSLVTSPAPIPPHTLPAQAIITAHTTPLLISQNSQLNAKIQTTQSQNASLMEEIQAQRREIESLLKGVEDTLKDVGGAGELLGEEMVVEGKSERARAAEAVLLGLET
jgi:kinetochore protein NNF1